jgi:uncharacterized membrane protein
MSATFAIVVTRWWTRVYTLGLPADLRAARRDEIESDLWESLHDPDAPRPQILPRLAGGVIDDVVWRSSLLPDETRTVGLTVATGCLLLVAMWEWLARPAVTALIIESVWLYPIIQSTHVLSIALFLGLNVILDFRLLGMTLRSVRASEMMADLLPWTTPASFLTLVTGMVLFLAEPGRFVVNPFFRIKLIALVLAVINLAVFHAAVYSRVKEWDDDSSPPFAARASAAISLTLWAIILIASRLVAYNWFG